MEIAVLYVSKGKGYVALAEWGRESSAVCGASCSVGDGARLYGFGFNTSYVLLGALFWFSFDLQHNTKLTIAEDMKKRPGSDQPDAAGAGTGGCPGLASTQ